MIDTGGHDPSTRGFEADNSPQTRKDYEKSALTFAQITSIQVIMSVE